VSVQSLPSSLPFIKGGKLKVLGVVNEKRISALPDVPTVGETVKGLGYTPWYGLFAPAGTPKAIIAQLQTEVARVLDSADVREKLASVGAEPYKTSPEQFGSMIKSELPRWAQIVKDANVTLD
jgi:tripartite-type tricarboxylate transporter receptor subunit TctC